MTTIHKKLALVAAVTLTMAACGDDDDEIIGLVPGVDVGTLAGAWTIEGTTDPEKCAQYGADRMRLVIYEDDGSVTATEIAPCRDFRRRLTLRARRYTGAATFINVNGDPVSKTLTVPPFTISGDAITPLVIDFPADTMTP